MTRDFLLWSLLNSFSWISDDQFGEFFPTFICIVWWYVCLGKFVEQGKSESLGCTRKSESLTEVGRHVDFDLSFQCNVLLSLTMTNHSWIVYCKISSPQKPEKPKYSTTRCNQWLTNALSRRWLVNPNMSTFLFVQKLQNSSSQDTDPGPVKDNRRISLLSCTGL